MVDEGALLPVKTGPHNNQPDAGLRSHCNNVDILLWDVIHMVGDRGRGVSYAKDTEVLQEMCLDVNMH